MLGQSNYQSGTPQDTQAAATAAANQAIIASGQSQIQSGQPFNDAQTVATQNLYNTVSGQQTSNNTPGYRQGVINGTQLGVGGQTIPQISNNYDQLAQQLAQYDQMVLQPQFAGTNPGTASDLASRAGGGYFNPNLSYNTTDAQTPEQTLYNTNPIYGLTGQANQGNNIIQLLGTLNNALSAESKRGQATYAGLMNSTGTTLSALEKLLGQSTDIKKTNAQIASEERRTQATINAENKRELWRLGYDIPNSTNLTGQEDTTGIYGPAYDSQGTLLHPELLPKGAEKMTGAQIAAATIATGGLPSGGDIQAMRSAYQAKIDSLPAVSPLRQKLATQFKTLTGKPLAIVALNSTDEASLKNTADLLRTIDRTINNITSSNQDKDAVAQWMMDQGGWLAGNVSDTPTKKTGSISRDLLMLRGMGEKSIIGGRLIRDLVTLFGGAFPSLYQDKATLLTLLKNMRDATVSDLGVHSSNEGYTNPQDFLTDHSIKDITVGDSPAVPSGSGGVDSIDQSLIDKYKNK